MSNPTIRGNCVLSIQLQFGKNSPRIAEKQMLPLRCCSAVPLQEPAVAETSDSKYTNYGNGRFKVGVAEERVKKKKSDYSLLFEGLAE
jgi:hypothetical protein